jgi:hypothetical protein
MNIKQIIPKVFHFEFDDHYDMCMTLIRYQENYESPSDDFRGKPFELLDFMEYYSKTFGEGTFSYCHDWDGFNLPSSVIQNLEGKITDFNKYDKKVYEAYNTCKEQVNEPFYIIGTMKGSGALEHEISHAFFYLYPEYKEHMTKLVEALDSKITKETNILLKRMGYTTEVFVDETQAYFATGLNNMFGEFFKWEQERKPFEEYFKEFKEKLNVKID